MHISSHYTITFLSRDFIFIFLYFPPLSLLPHTIPFFTFHLCHTTHFMSQSHTSTSHLYHRDHHTTTTFHPNTRTSLISIHFLFIIHFSPKTSYLVFFAPTLDSNRISIVIPVILQPLHYHTSPSHPSPSCHISLFIPLFPFFTLFTSNRFS